MPDKGELGMTGILPRQIPYRHEWIYTNDEYMTNKLVLGSISPRRKELMNLGGWEFDIRPAHVDEDLLPEEEPRKYVLRVAASKARTVAAQVATGNLVITADTTVVDPQGKILAKPQHEQEAKEMLERLRGRTHQVLTGIAVMRAFEGPLYQDVCVTDVKMRDYSMDEMMAYIASGDPFDKAGGYAIQHQKFHPVEAINGCYANVVGLPVCTLGQLLKPFGIETPAGVPKDCPSKNYTDCSICEQLDHHLGSL
jgi:septum formation protein